MRLGKAIKPNQTITIKKSGNNKDIINALHKYMPYAIMQSKKRSSMFKGKDNKETARNIWSFLKHNIKYGKIIRNYAYETISLINSRQF